MESDFPAAHSTDSTWFAVDKDGRVGYFETGEAGAYPERCLMHESADIARERLREALPSTTTLVDPDGRRIPFMGEHGRWHVFGDSQWPVLMFLDSLDPVKRDLEVENVKELPSRKGHAILWPSLTREEYDRFHVKGTAICKGCNWLFLEEREESLAARGIYVFSALGGNSTANPYGVQELPSRPIHVDQLPPDMRERVKTALFSKVSFENDPVFQPAEHLPCGSYDGTYCDMKGALRHCDTHKIVDSEDDE